MPSILTIRYSNGTAVILDGQQNLIGHNGWLNPAYMAPNEKRPIALYYSSRFQQVFNSIPNVILRPRPLEVIAQRFGLRRMIDDMRDDSEFLKNFEHHNRWLNDCILIWYVKREPSDQLFVSGFFRNEDDAVEFKLHI